MFSLKGPRRAWYVCVPLPSFIFKLPPLQWDGSLGKAVTSDSYPRLDQNGLIYGTRQHLQRLPGRPTISMLSAANQGANLLFSVAGVFLFLIVITFHGLLQSAIRIFPR